MSAKGARAKVYIDGKFSGRINTYKVKSQFRRIVFSRSLAPGVHTLRIVNLATKSRPRLDIDAIAAGS